MIRNYIFDFDGTLADTLQLVIDIFNELSVEYYFSQIEDENIFLLRNKGSREFFKSLNINPTQIQEIINKVKLKQSGLIKDVDIFPEIKEVLTELKNRDIQLGVLTSNSVDNIKLLLTKYDIELFSFIISENNLFGKAKFLKQVISEINLDPNETAYVGDEDRDIEAAKESGLKTVAVTWGFNSKELLERSQLDYLIETPKELLILE